MSPIFGDDPDYVTGGHDGPDDDGWIRDEPGTQATNASKLRYEQLRSRLLTADQLKALPPPQPLIDGYLSRNSLAALYGRPGTGKSFLAVAIGLSVVTGQPFFGHDVIQGPVLYIAAEGTAGLGQRQEAWHEMCGGDLSDMHWLPCAVNLIDFGWAAGLIDVVEELQPVLVIIDTLNRSMPGGDENSSADMGALVDAAHRIRESCGTTVLLVHHTPKEGSTLRGHSSLEGAIDTGLFIESAGERTFTLSVEKQKDVEKIAPLVLELAKVGSSCVLFVPQSRGTSFELVESERRVRQAVWDNCGTDGLPASTLLELSGVSKSAFYRALKSLDKQGIIRNVGSDKRARYAATADLDIEQSHGVPNSPMGQATCPSHTPPFKGVGLWDNSGGN